jgi:hypothetical protein
MLVFGHNLHRLVQHLFAFPLLFQVLSALLDLGDISLVLESLKVFVLEDHEAFDFAEVSLPGT